MAEAVARSRFHHRIQAPTEANIRLVPDHPQIRLRQGRQSLRLYRPIDEGKQGAPLKAIGLPGEECRVRREENDAGASPRRSRFSLRPGHPAADPCHRGCRIDTFGADTGRSPTNLRDRAQAGALLSNDLSPPDQLRSGRGTRNRT